MAYEIGSKVLIRLDPNEQIKSIQEVWNFQGKEATIAKKKVIGTGKLGAARGTYYELNGVYSQMGVPFSFLEEQLIPLD